MLVSGFLDCIREVWKVLVFVLTREWSCCFKVSESENIFVKFIIDKYRYGVL